MNPSSTVAESLEAPESKEQVLPHVSWPAVRDSFAARLELIDQAEKLATGIIDGKEGMGRLRDTVRLIAASKPEERQGFEKDLMHVLDGLGIELETANDNATGTEVVGTQEEKAPDQLPDTTVAETTAPPETPPPQNSQDQILVGSRPPPEFPPPVAEPSAPEPAPEATAPLNATPEQIPAESAKSLEEIKKDIEAMQGKITFAGLMVALNSSPDSAGGRYVAALKAIANPDKIDIADLRNRYSEFEEAGNLLYEELKSSKAAEGVLTVSEPTVTVDAAPKMTPEPTPVPEPVAVGAVAGDANAGAGVTLHGQGDSVAAGGTPLTEVQSWSSAENSANKPPDAPAVSGGETVPAVPGAEAAPVAPTVDSYREAVPVAGSVPETGAPEISIPEVPQTEASEPVAPPVAEEPVTTQVETTGEALIAETETPEEISEAEIREMDKILNP